MAHDGDGLLDVENVKTLILAERTSLQAGSANRKMKMSQEIRAKKHALAQQVTALRRELKSFRADQEYCKLAEDAMRSIFKKVAGPKQ